jgi:hypothetical protein
MKSINFVIIMFFSICGFAQTKIEREVTIKQGDAPKKAVQFIEKSNIKSKYSRYKIQKLQFQYSGQLTSVHDLQNAKLKYEIEVYAKKENEISKPYEITFDHKGTHLLTRTIQPSKLENIEN